MESTEKRMGSTVRTTRGNILYKTLVAEEIASCVMLKSLEFILKVNRERDL